MQLVVTNSSKLMSISKDIISNPRARGPTFKARHQNKIMQANYINLQDVAPFLNGNLNVRERSLWLFVYLVAFTLCACVCGQLVTSYLESPIVVSVDLVDGSLADQVFPAVTVCNIRRWLVQSAQMKLEHMKSRIDTAIPQCSWRTIKVPCSKLFDPVLTDWETFCYTFNYGHPEKYSSMLYFNWNASNLNNVDVDVDTDRPRKSCGIGVANGISVILDILRLQNGGNEREDLISLKRDSLGFMVLVHYPDEFPMMAGQAMHIAPGLENNFKIDINKFHTSSAVKVHPAASRRKNCYFEGDRQLTYFKSYSFSACRIQCVVNMTLNKCGCRHWTSPGSPLDKLCANDNETQCHTWISYGLQKNEEEEFTNHWKQCQCQNRCTYTTYSISSSYALLDAASVAEKFNKTIEYVRYNMVIVNVYFVRQEVMMYRRDVLSTISNLCSSIGGILGSILGWSLISLIRIIFALIVHFQNKKSSKIKPFFVKNKTSIKTINTQ